METLARGEGPGAGRPGRRSAVGIGHALDVPGGDLGFTRQVFKPLGRGLAGVEQVEIGEWPGGQTLAGRKAGVGILGRQAGHGHGPLGQLAAAVGGDIGAGDGGLSPADENPQA